MIDQFIFSGKRRRTKEKVSILFEPWLFQTIQGLSGVSLRKSVLSIIKSGLIPGGRSLKKGKTICVVHCSEPDSRWSLYGGDSMRFDKAKDCSIQKYLETSSKYSILVQFETRSRERIAVLSNKVACNRPLQHTISCLHRERSMHEDEGWAFPKGTLDSESTAGCTKIELANWSTRSTWTGYLGNWEQHRGLHNSCCASFCSWTARYTS